MTETIFPEMMKRPETGFDAMDADNIAPLVVWLGSEQSREVSGRVFEVSGGWIAAGDGWRRGPVEDVRAAPLLAGSKSALLAGD